jgi:C4-dicarboxylate-specific signal transduction histidine kinase
MGVRLQIFLFTLSLLLLFAACALAYSVFLAPRFEKQREAELFGEVVAASGNMEAEANRLLYNDLLVQAPKFLTAAERYEASRTAMGTVEALTRKDRVFSESITAVARLFDRNVELLDDFRLALDDLILSLRGTAPMNGWTLESLALFDPSQARGAYERDLSMKARRLFADLHVLNENLTTARRSVEERSKLIAMEIGRIEKRNNEFLGIFIAAAVLASLSLSFRIAGSIIAKNERSKAALHSVNEELSGSLQRLEKTQEKLIRSEKLAALGKLAAGLAHELNSPIGAVVSANGSVRSYLAEDFPKAVELLSGLESEKRSLYFSILSARGLQADPFDLGPDQRAIGAAAERLAAIGAPSSPRLAELAAERDFAGLLDSRPEIFSDPRCAELLEAAGEQIAAMRMIDVVAIAAEKATNVVNTLRQYLRSESDAEHGVVDVERGLEMVLTLLSSTLKEGIRVERDYCGAAALGSPERLGQVWMNLITNAAQAMEFKGLLRLSTKIKEGMLEVMVGDEGSGIAPEIRDLVFEPFFSTKHYAEGLGLGLDICRTIVEGHKGSLSFESSPGDTRFIVRLPLARDPG